MNAYRFYSCEEDYSGIIFASSIEEAREKVERFIKEFYEEETIPDDLLLWNLEDDADFHSEYGVFEH